MRASRREFCATVALSATSLLLPARRHAAALDAPKAQDFRLKYIVSAALYGTLSLDVVLKELKKTGAEAVDIWSQPHGSQRDELDDLGLERVATLLDENQVRLGAITRYDLGPGQLQSEIQIAKELGGGMIITGAKKPPGKNWKEQVRNFVESMKSEAELAARSNVTIGIENHGKTPINTPESIRYFAELVDFPNFGLAMAPYHLPQDPELIGQLITELGPKLVFFQGWEYGMGCMEKLPKDQEMKQLPGRGTLDFKPILSALKSSNYQGWTEVFMHPTPRGIAIRETPQQVTEEIVQSQDYLNQCLSEVSSA